MADEIRITHIMADGTIRKSIEGVKITNKEFYVIFNELRKKTKWKNQ